MHEMRTFAIDDFGRQSVSQSVSQSVCRLRGFARLRFADTAELIEMGWKLVGTKGTFLDVN